MVVRVGGRDADERQQPFARLLDRGPRRLRRLGRKPAARVLEHDDVASVVRGPPRRQLVDEDPVLDEEGVLHRARRDEEAPHDEGLHEERDENRDQQDNEDVAEEDDPAAPSSSRLPIAAQRSRLGGDVVAHRLPYTRGSGRPMAASLASHTMRRTERPGTSCLGALQRRGPRVSCRASP
ncbi:hypothetical protein ABE10_01460 [Bacillus toyonensis]|nr:hypothetical protein [Bacillus toyonensis]